MPDSAKTTLHTPKYPRDFIRARSSMRVSFRWDADVMLNPIAADRQGYVRFCSFVYDLIFYMDFPAFFVILLYV